MTIISVIGLQWGDEGKGKVIDLLAQDAEVVVRYQGGCNAGHTVIVGGRKYVLHQIPSGILHAGRLCVIAHGVVVDPKRLVAEIVELAEQGIDIGDQLRVSAGCHLVMPYHERLDRAFEANRGANRIGTTGRGIGPCYADKAARVGFRMADLVDDAGSFPERLAARVEMAGRTLSALYGDDAPLDVAAMTEEYLALGERLAPHVTDTAALLQECVANGRQILFEGAQGAMLDIDTGTYPFVTSSNTGSGSIGTGTGVPGRCVDTVLGVLKAYCTRVGEGPFPTEAPGELGELLRARGGEYGATTGRPRRCGFFDVIAARSVIAANGVDELVVTKLDVLSDLESIPVCVGYRIDGQATDRFPVSRIAQQMIEPIYEELPGWKQDLTGITELDELPLAARRYLAALQDYVGIPIRLASVGADRKQIIDCRRASFEPVRGA
ncbi:MAG: adenylosuccinate synthase [Planctomycetota bacterium]